MTWWAALVVGAGAAGLACACETQTADLEIFGPPLTDAGEVEHDTAPEGMREAGRGGEADGSASHEIDAEAPTPCATSKECSGESPVCSTTTGVCVECVVNADCSEGACEPASQRCVGCLSDTGCVQSSAPFCDLERHECVQCLGDAACGGATPFCSPSEHTCVQCVVDEQCSSGLTCSSGQCH